MIIPVNCEVGLDPFRLLLIGLCVSSCAAAANAGDAPAIALLKDKCFGCHGAAKQEGGLRLDVRGHVLAGGDSGPAVVPGNADSSQLLRRVLSSDDDRMPPEGTRLTQAEVWLLRRWIDSGAGGLPEHDLNAKWRTHWSFQKISMPVPPVIEDSHRVRNSVDAFVIHELQKAGITPSPPADRATLIRRLSLDVTGLLPEPKRVQQFVSDKRPDAWEQLIDEYLASPHYGERWARHWMDVARYADSTGYEADQPRTIWAWRDWVINSFNQGMPFDQFVIEQIAGDLLPEASKEQIIATGFHCNSIFDGGVRWQAVVDRVNTTAAAFLGLTTECARCHTHKTDPVSHREFYELFAFFNDASATSFSLGETGYLDQVPKPDESGRMPPVTLAMKATPQPTHVFGRGDPAQPGIHVSPNVPGFLPQLRIAGDRRASRLDLARWLMKDDHPLTARVTVNRVWQRYFGAGLVETSDDFGMQTPRPKHAALLDWLAARFMQEGWDVKKLHKHILLSATYRQSSNDRRELASADPGNRLLARQVRIRLPAEIIRDVFLNAGGLLSRKIGGPGVYPWQPEGILVNRATPATWEKSEGEDAYRRGLYTWTWRLTPHPHMPLFDAPDGITACTKRSRSNVPVQALTLLNDPVFVEAAQGLGRRVLRGPTGLSAVGSSDPERLKRLFQITLARDPQPREEQLLLDFLERQRKSFHGQPAAAREVCGDAEADRGQLSQLAAWTVLARSVLNLDEFYTRE